MIYFLLYLSFVFDKKISQLIQLLSRSVFGSNHFLLLLGTIFGTMRRLMSLFHFNLEGEVALVYLRL